MAITVYWACVENEWLRAQEPIAIYKNFAEKAKNIKTGISLCPSIKVYMNNMFALKSIYDYEFTVDKETNQITSLNYDQKFFMDHCVIRSESDKIFSFHQKFIFFTEENSLKMSGGIFPFLEDNDITKRCIVIPGQFDIAKWFRPLEFAFMLKDDQDTFKIKENDSFQYLNFHTDEKIIFKQFAMNDKLREYIFYIGESKENRRTKIRNLENYYSMFKNKKRIIKEIKDNIVEKD